MARARLSEIKAAVLKEEAQRTRLSLRPGAYIQIWAGSFALMVLWGPILQRVTGLVALIVLVALYRMKRRSRQLKLNERAAEMLAVPDANFLLYLRPFITAGDLLVPNGTASAGERFLMGRYWDFEFALSLATEEKSHLVAIGDSGESLGAGKLAADSETWKELMQVCAERASVIVVVPYDRPSTAWEVRYLAAAPELLRKTIFFMPPGKLHWYDGPRSGRYRERREMWARATATFAADGIELPQFQPAGCWFRINEKGRVDQTYPLLDLEPGYAWTLIEHVGRLGKGEASVDAELRTRVEALSREKNRPVLKWLGALKVGAVILFGILALTSAWLSVEDRLASSTIRGWSTAEWNRLKSVEGRFTAWFPEPPKHARHALGQIELLSYGIELESRWKASLAVAYFDHPPMRDDPVAALNGARDGAIKNMQATLLSERRIELSGHPGREIVATVSGGALTYKARIYLVGDRLYQVSTISNDVVYDPVVQRFLDSFSLQTE